MPEELAGHRGARPGRSGRVVSVGAQAEWTTYHGDAGPVPLLWSTPSTANAKVYGLDPSAGAVAVAEQTPAIEHFATPAASDGRIFLGTDSTLGAYTFATAVAPGCTAPSPLPVIPTPKPIAPKAATAARR